MKNLSLKTRAWFVHLMLSGVILLPVVLVVYFWWFPHPFFRVQDVSAVFFILVGIQLLLGPLLTFVVYAPQKKGLKFDLAVIALVQLAALGYGLYSIESERPAYVVFAVDRYVPVAAKDVDFASAGMDGFGDGVPGAPVYVFSELPMGEAFQAFQNSVLFGGQPDLERRPEFWLPMDTGRAAVLASARSLAALMDARPAAAQRLAAAAGRLDMTPEGALFVPLPGKREDFAAIIDPVTATVVDAITVDPWIGQGQAK